MRKDVKINMSDSMDSTPIAELVGLANEFRSRIYFEMGKTRVNAKSIMGMMSLVLVNDAVVTIDANGEDENDAISTLERFLTK